MTKLLAIDARPLARGAGGIQRYLQNILPYLIHNDSFELILYSDHSLDLSSYESLGKIKTRSIHGRFCRSVVWHFAVCVWAAIDKPDLFWSPRHHLPFILPRKTKRIVTIHDFVWKTSPSTMPKLQLASEKILMPFALKNATKIICISETTQSQLSHFFPSYAHKSSVILHGTYKPTHKVKDCNADLPGYFLAVGTLEPRKNYPRLIIAFDLYLKNGGKKSLIIVGKYGWGYTSILNHLKKSDNADRMKILQTVSDLELSELYSRACGFISPSLDEGYGLPAQEAIHYKLPLLLSNIAVYRELYSEANLWIDPLSINELTSGLHKLEKLPRQNIPTSSIDYSWSDCANKHCEEFLREDL